MYLAILITIQNQISEERKGKKKERLEKKKEKDEVAKRKAEERSKKTVRPQRKPKRSARETTCSLRATEDTLSHSLITTVSFSSSVGNSNDVVVNETHSTDTIVAAI